MHNTLNDIIGTHTCVMTNEKGRWSAPMLDDAFDALASRHRRRILVALLEHNPRSDGVQAEGARKESYSEGNVTACRLPCTTSTSQN